MSSVPRWIAAQQPKLLKCGRSEKGYDTFYDTPAKPQPRQVIDNCGFGPDGAYGHPDHCLAGDVVTRVVQSGAVGASRQLLYFGFPKDRLSHWHGQEPLSATEPSYLTVGVPYSKDDLLAFQKSLRCYKTQFLPEEIDALSKQADDLWGGRIYLRPWFGTEEGDDLFALKDH
jgi:LmbE family N-acetylglucosaminyl deacetylase